MNIACEQLNPFACKTYLLTVEGSSEAVMIDPVLDHVQDYVKLLKERGLELSTVIDTHTHADHISGAAALKDVTDCEYFMHGKAPAQCVTRRIADGDSLTFFGQVEAKVIHSPGHTKDSVSLVFPDRLFSGDALFLDDGGAGRDDLPGGDASDHWATLQKLSELPDDIIVFPAHDYRERKPSSMKHQKETNPHLQKAAGTKEEFVAYIEDLKLGPADWMKDVLKANYACARDPRAAWIPVDTPACEVKGTLDLGVNDIEVAPITAAELKEQIAAGNTPVLLDVREPPELAGPLGSIDGVLNIPVGDLSGRLAELESHKNTDVVAVCRSGGRAHTAAQILIQAGFTSVKVLMGGMGAWDAG